MRAGFEPAFAPSEFWTPLDTRTAMGRTTLNSVQTTLLGPITFGALLDAGGGAASTRAWLLAFAGVALVSLAGVAALGYESRSATIGSTRIARRAGR